ncbi:MAG: tetratricopeptide repeat protein [Acidobacteria bacterium]|nr:tetratricopeptide repeat protein [Acidobacteriota bacterium]
MTAADLVRKSQDAYDREDYEEAEALARRALMMDPLSIDAKQVLSGALIEQSRYDEAVPWLQELITQAPDDVISLSDLGLCLFEMCLFDEAEEMLRRALEVDANDPYANYWMALCVEQRGHLDLADEYFARANEIDPNACAKPSRVRREDFDKVVQQALRELPEAIRRHLANVSVIVDELPRREDLTEFEPPLEPSLLGLYVGVPLPDRSLADPPRLPDRIYIYKRNLERICPDRETLLEQIRITVLHEIGHYLGWDEDDLAERGYA